MEENVIRVSHLTKIYKLYDRPSDRVKEAFHPFRKRYSRDFYALRDISFSLRRGEMLGIIGKNGAGKSTLLKMITGVLTPSGGDMEINGRVASLLELGAGFNPEMTGIENIYVNGTIMGYSKEEMDGRLSAIVDFADIGDFIHQPVKMYSSGMYARLAFAVNAFVEPDILIVDEALSVGDVFFQNKCFRKFEDLRKKDVTILFVSHDTGAVRRYCDRVLWLEAGQMKEMGDCGEICDHYLKDQLVSMNEVNEASLPVAAASTLPDAASGRKVFPARRGDRRIIENRPEEGRLVSFFITDKEGIMVSVLYTGERYTFHVVGEFYRDLDDVIFGAIVETVQGICVLAFNTFMPEQRDVVVRSGTVIEVQFTFFMPLLLEGTYLASPAIARGVQDRHINLVWWPSYQEVQIISRKGKNLSLVEIPFTQQMASFDREVVSFENA